MKMEITCFLKVSCRLRYILYLFLILDFMKIQELIQLLDKWAPNSYAEDFDNIGLLVGNSRNECSGILITLDTTEAIIEEAITKSCNVILSFHPIIFSGLKKLTGKSYVERVVLKAIENKISIIALHTRLDNHPHGMNDILAKRLELTNTEVLIQKKRNIKKASCICPRKLCRKSSSLITSSRCWQLG